MTASKSHLPRRPLILGHLIADAMSTDELNTRIENILRWQPIEGRCNLQFVASIVPARWSKRARMNSHASAEDLLPELHQGVGDSTLAAVGRQRRTACSLEAWHVENKCDCPCAVQEMSSSCPTFRFEAPLGDLVFHAHTQPPPEKTGKKLRDIGGFRVWIRPRGEPLAAQVYAGGRPKRS